MMTIIFLSIQKFRPIRPIRQGLLKKLEWLTMKKSQ